MKCPYCNNTKFYEGPSGGLSTNILCANKDCRHWFNRNTLTGELEDLNRVEDSESDLQRKERENRESRDKYRLDKIEEGAKACRDARPLSDIFYSSCAWHQVCGADLYRISGYLHELRTRL